MSDSHERYRPRRVQGRLLLRSQPDDMDYHVHQLVFRLAEVLEAVQEVEISRKLAKSKLCMMQPHKASHIMFLENAEPIRLTRELVDKAKRALADADEHLRCLENGVDYANYQIGQLTKKDKKAKKTP